MPTYVYRCRSCEVEVEAQRKMSQADDPLGCPLCGETLLRGITSFMLNTGRGTAVPDATPPATNTISHGVGCPCCRR
ncbi:MAG: zinc ribbon domain-containing protein [Chloroflexi bacterium]|nr:zinc ribbon domain-containing protein [Ardenticatenaceae bacterium]NOG37021.1 zinc ribbon domain-containing protein [Chloroflexota bacterium]